MNIRRKCCALAVMVALAGVSCTESTEPGSASAKLVDRIVFQSDRLDSKGDIFSMALDGSDVRRLTEGTTWDHCVSLSPNGQLIAFVGPHSNSGLAVMRADGSNLQSLLPGASESYACPAWSSDSELLAYTSVNSITIVTVGGAPVATIQEIGSQSSLWWTAFSPDGSRLVFVELLPVSDGYNDFRVWTVAVHDPTRRILAPGLQPTWTKNSERIVYVCLSNITSHNGPICTMALDGSDIKVVTPGNAASPRVSPDGSRIAYECDGELLCFVNLDGTSFVRTNVYGRNFVWAPDGRSLAYECTVQEPGRLNAEICGVSMEGMGVTRLTNNPGADSRPSFSPVSTH